MEKVSAARKIRDKRGLDFHIEVDGGIAPETASIVREASANVLVAETSVFRVPINRLRLPDNFRF